MVHSKPLRPEWLPAVDGLVERLESGLRVIDVGCGLGSATILMAEAFPASTFVGVDYHEESIRQATAARPSTSSSVSSRISRSSRARFAMLPPYSSGRSL